MLTRTKLLPILALLFALALALGTAHKAQSLHSPDFDVFYTAARHALVDPVNIYRVSPDRYLYPPSTALLLTPFAFTDNFALHQWAWHGLLALLLFWLSSASFAALAAMALLTRYLAITFSYGQINLVVLTLMAAAGRALRLRKNGTAGCLWAIAASVKVYPLVLAPAFLPRRRWGAWVSAFVTLLVLFQAPILIFGVQKGFQLYGDFFEAIRAKGLPLHSHNQSIAAFLLRVFSNQEFYLHAVGPTRWGLFDLPEGLLRGVAWLLGGGLALASWWRAWKRGLSASASLAAASFSILFLSHIVWKDYLLLLFFPLSDLFSRWPLRASLFLAGAFLVLVTISSPDLLGAPLSTRFDAACIHLWAAILVWGLWWKK